MRRARNHATFQNDFPDPLNNVTDLDNPRHKGAGSDAGLGLPVGLGHGGDADHKVLKRRRIEISSHPFCLGWPKERTLDCVNLLTQPRLHPFAQPCISHSSLALGVPLRQVPHAEVDGLLAEGVHLPAVGAVPQI